MSAEQMTGKDVIEMLSEDRKNMEELMTLVAIGGALHQAGSVQIKLVLGLCARELVNRKELTEENLKAITKMMPNECYCGECKARGLLEEDEKTD